MWRLRGHKRAHEVTRGHKRAQEVTRGHERSREVTHLCCSEASLVVVRAERPALLLDEAEGGQHARCVGVVVGILCDKGNARARGEGG